MSRLMAIDHGRKRIGIALSDPLRLFARPHTIIERGSKAEDFAQMRDIIAKNDVDKIVVGLPSDAQSGIGPQAAKVIRWARKLHAAVERPISLWDESYTSERAKEVAARNKRSHGDPIDDIAAALILQEYLELGGADHEPGTPLESYQDTVE